MQNSGWRLWFPEGLFPDVLNLLMASSQVRLEAVDWKMFHLVSWTWAPGSEAPSDRHTQPQMDKSDSEDKRFRSEWHSEDAYSSDVDRESSRAPQGAPMKAAKKRPFRLYRS